IFSDERVVRDLTRRQAPVNDAAVSMRLQAHQIRGLAVSNTTGVFGLTLYIMNAERLDLYMFCAVALLSWALTRPSREKWEAAFRSVAVGHPEVSSSPW